MIHSAGSLRHKSPFCALFLAPVSVMYPVDYHQEYTAYFL